MEGERVQKKLQMNIQTIEVMGLNSFLSKDNTEHDKVDSNEFEKQMSFFWNVMKVVNLNVVSYNSKTGAKFHWFSPTTGLFALLYAWWCYPFYKAAFAMEEYNLYTGNVFENSVFNILVRLSYCIHFLPLICFIEARKVATYRQQWATFQAEYLKQTGHVLKLKLRSDVKKVLGVCFFLTFKVMFMIFILKKYFFYTTNQIIDWKMFMFYSLYHCFLLGTITLYMGQWIILTKALKKAGDAIYADLEEVVCSKRSITGRDVFFFEKYWWQLFQLVRATGSTFSDSMIFFIILLFSEIIASLYLFLANVAEGFTVQFIIPLYYSLPVMLMLALLTWSADTATQKIGDEFIMSLHKLKCRIKSEEVVGALESFMSTINTNPPILNLNGYVTVNKRLTTSLLSAMVTYLIVLVQFQGSAV